LTQQIKPIDGKYIIEGQSSVIQNNLLI